MSKTYVGDAGTRITLDCGTDISTSSARTIEVRKPSGATASWAATLTADNEGVYYDTAADTLDQPGTWMLQAKVTIGTGVWLGETVTLQVYAPWA